MSDFYRDITRRQETQAPAAGPCPQCQHLVSYTVDTKRRCARCEFTWTPGGGRRSHRSRQRAAARDRLQAELIAHAQGRQEAPHA